MPILDAHGRAVGAAPPSDRQASRAGASPLTEPGGEALPLVLRAAYAVYTALGMLDGQEPGAAALTAFLASPDDVQACSLLAQVSLAVCGETPQLRALRTVALEVLHVAPELGERLIQALAELDASLQGKA